MAAREIPIDVLLDHAAFLRRLAGTLVADPATADDLVQETWLAALEHPPRAGRPAGGWLGTVLRNVARKAFRSRMRRERRERATARGEGTLSVGEQVARDEVLGRLHAALARLDFLQRTVIRMRFYEGLPPREIAARLGVPRDTVKSRLRLAIAHLRRDLEGGSTGPHADWRGVLAVSVGLRLAKGAAVGTKAKVSAAVAAAVLLGVGTWATVEWSGRAPEREAAPPAVAARRADAQPDAAKLEGSAALRRRATPTPAPTPAPPSGRSAAPTASELEKLGLGAETAPDTLEAVVLDGTTPLRVGTGLLWSAKAGHGGGPESIPINEEPTGSRILSRDGVFRFDALPDDEWFLGVDLGDGVRRLSWRKLETGKSRNARVFLVLGDAGIYGTVCDDEGHAAAGLRVRADVDTGTDLPPTCVETRTDLQGHYAIDRLPGGGMAWVTVATTGNLDDPRGTRPRQVALPAGAKTRVDFGSASGIAHLEGTLRCSDGEPLSGKRRIVLSRKDPDEYVVVPVDAGGRYAQRVPPGRWRVAVWSDWVAKGPNPRLPCTDAEIAMADVDLEHDFVVPGTRILGSVRVEGAAAGVRNLWTAISARDPKGLHASMPVGPDGAFEWYGLAPGEYELSAGAGTLRSAPVTVVVAQGDVELRRSLVLGR